ncbi:MAG: hypothetical protein U0744_06075 [Gemmataceae bacterium]
MLFARNVVLTCVMLALAACSAQAQPEPRYKKFRETPAKLDDSGRFSHRGELTGKDPRTPLFLGDDVGEYAVRYLLSVDRGKTYTFEMKSGFGPFLLLTDTKNNEIGRAASKNGKAELTHQAPGDGAVFLYATTEKAIGAFELAIRGPAKDTRPAPTAPPIPPTPVATGAATHERVKFYVGEHADVAWAPDGETFFILLRNGKLGAFSAKTLEKLRETDLKSHVTQMAYCSTGLAVVHFGGELQILDPETFNVKNKINVPNLHRIAATPKSKLAVAGVYRTEASLTVLDLEKGAVVKQYRDKPNNFFALSDDGKRLFSIAGAEMVSWQLSDKGELEDEQFSKPVHRYPQSVCLSPDGKFICVPCMGGNVNAEGLPKIDEHSTYVFASNDIKKPMFVLPGTQPNRSIVLDNKTGFIAAMGQEKQLKLYSFRGELLSEHELAPPRNYPDKFVGSPQGGVLLAMFYRYVEFVRLPKSK